MYSPCTPPSWHISKSYVSQRLCHVSLKYAVGVVYASLSHNRTPIPGPVIGKPLPVLNSVVLCIHSYVEVRLLLAPFASTAHHPCHMTYLVPTSTTILSLQHQLNSSLGTTATAVAVFSEQCVKPSNRIPPRCTLMEMGVVGGERTTPPKATLYYDYIPVSIQCPVLMTDHYYGDVDQSN